MKISLLVLFLSSLLLPCRSLAAAKDVSGWEKLKWGDDIDKVKMLYQKKIEIPSYNEKRAFPPGEEHKVAYVMRNYKKISGINFNVYFLKDKEQRLEGVSLLTDPNDFIFRADFNYVAKIMRKKLGKPTRTGDHTFENYDYYRRIWSFKSTEIELTFYFDILAANITRKKRLGLRTSGIYRTNLKISYYNKKELSKNGKDALARADESGRLQEGRLLYEMTLSGESVFFAFDKAYISAGAAGALDLFIKRLKQQGDNAYLEIQGHTDARGTEEYNLKLARTRAESVRRYLNNTNAIARPKMSTVSYGESRPVAGNDTDAGRAKNRRVTIVVMK